MVRCRRRVKARSYRQSLHATIAPLGRLVSSELTAKFETDVQLGWGELKAGDIASSARAFRTMVEAGLSLSDAAGLSGLMVRNDVQAGSSLAPPGLQRSGQGSRMIFLVCLS